MLNFSIILVNIVRQCPASTPIPIFVHYRDNILLEFLMIHVTRVYVHVLPKFFQGHFEFCSTNTI